MNGDALRRLSADCAEPDWSPDGSHIVFVSDRSKPKGHASEIYAMAGDGSDLRRLTRNDVWDVDPAWGPRG